MFLCWLAADPVLLGSAQLIGMRRLTQERRMGRGFYPSQGESCVGIAAGLGCNRDAVAHQRTSEARASRVGGPQAGHPRAPSAAIDRTARFG